MLLRDVVVDGIPGYRLGNALIELVCLPTLGGKLVSLRDRRTGREWLWRSDQMALGGHPYGASYVGLADTGGWDECFPTVAPAIYPDMPWKGLEVPDHGELWSQAWPTEVRRSEAEVELNSEVRGVQFPYIFRRSACIRADQATLHLAYEVENTGGAALSWIWSSHPLFRLEAGMRLSVPESARFNLAYSPDTTSLAQTQGLQWPIAGVAEGGEFACDPLPPPEAGAAFKVWSDPLEEGWARLDAADGALEMRFDPAEIPQLGIWLNAGGWNGAGGAPYFNLALEPCIGAQDSLADAVERHGIFGSLPPFGCRRWGLEVRLSVPSQGRATQTPASSATPLCSRATGTQR